jgi:hypothetical protein
MRAIVFSFGLAACTPDIVSGAYLCGPEASCPAGQVCSGRDNTCVLPSLAEPFSCESEMDFEPDDTIVDAHLIENLGCVSALFANDACMLAGDTADWLAFVPPSVCSAVEVQARLSFPVAFEELGLELWDIDHDMPLETDTACKQGAGTGEVRRCLDFVLVPGTKYGIKVHPTGKGTCGGACAYNRYTLSVQLATPG